MKKITVTLATIAMVAAATSCKKESRKTSTENPTIITPVDFRDTAEGTFVYGLGTKDEWEVEIVKDSTTDNRMLLLMEDGYGASLLNLVDSSEAIYYDLSEDNMTGFFDLEENSHNLIDGGDTLVFERHISK